MNAIPRTFLTRAAAHSPAGLMNLSSAGKMLPYKHVVTMSDMLRQVTLGDKKKVMFNLPPQHGKSEQTSRTYPAWHLGHKPDDKVICASYGESLSKKAGRSNRELIRNYGPSLFGVDLSPDNQEVLDWSINGHRGGLRSVGVGSGLVGFPADLLIIDDPYRDYPEALNPLGRERVWDWYTTVALTRLSKRGRIVIIQTRWHPDDLSGHLLKTEGDEWTVISMPAISKDGLSLCEELHPLSKLREYEKTLGPYKWNCLYQQNPIATGKTHWDEKYFQDVFVERFPPGIKFACVAIDPASGKTKRRHDFPAVILLATADFKTFYVDAIMEKMNFAKLRPKVVKWLSQREKRPEPSVLSIEVDSKIYLSPHDFSNFEIGRLFQTEIERAGLRTGVMLHTVPSGLSKEWRIERLDEVIHNGRVKFVRNKHTEEVVDQLVHFGVKGYHDDGPDGLDAAFQIIKKLIAKMRK